MHSPGVNSVQSPPGRPSYASSSAAPERVRARECFADNFLAEHIWINGVRHDRKTVSLHALCKGFFEFYLNFPWATHAVCLRNQ